MSEVDLCVDLGRGQRAVAEKLLDHTQIHTGLEKMGRERVTQSVRMEMVEISSAAHSFIDDSSDRPITEPATALIDEERIILGSDFPTPLFPYRKVRSDG